MSTHTPLSRSSVPSPGGVSPPLRASIPALSTPKFLGPVPGGVRPNEVRHAVPRLRGESNIPGIGWRTFHFGRGAFAVSCRRRGRRSQPCPRRSASSPTRAKLDQMVTIYASRLTSTKKRRPSHWRQGLVYGYYRELSTQVVPRRPILEQPQQRLRRRGGAGPSRRWRGSSSWRFRRVRVCRRCDTMASDAGLQMTDTGRIVDVQALRYYYLGLID